VSSTGQRLVHIVDAVEWEEFIATGADTWTPPSLGTVGFVHLSTPEQAAVAANRHYRGARGLQLLVLDASILRSGLVWEEGDPPEPGMVFPHLYAPLPVAAVLYTVAYPPGADGRFAEPEL